MPPPVNATGIERQPTASTRWPRAGAGSLLAAVVVCVAVWLLLSLRFSLGFNSHYVDESDYMFAGRLLLDGSLWPTKTYIFSSNLPLYLIGWGANLDYEYGARALSLIPGLFSLGALYLLYLSMLGNRTLALLAAALIGLQATHIFQSKLATYDIWCFFLFVTAAWQLHSHARTRRHLSLQMICGSLLFACAVLSKYVVVIYAPLFFALLWIGSSRGSAVLFAILQTLVLGIYAMQNAAELQILFNTQLAGQHLHNSSGWQVLWLLGGLLWPLLIMTPASIWKTLRRQQSFLDLPAINRNSLKVLIILAIALPAYHLISGNRIAMYKHALYSAIFLAPVAAAGLALMVRSLKPGFQAPVASLVLALLTVIAVLQTRAMESAFPDTRAVMSVLDQQVTHRSRILSENPYLHRSHFLDRIALQNLYDMDSLPAAGSPENDARLVREFITAGFDFVLLDGRFDPARTALLRANMPAHYELVHSEPYATSDISSGNTHGEITLYRAIDQSPHY